ncbi:MAG: glycosyltransferase family 4 protein [Candidatus Competibacter sp.]|nr:glycosyltransferase family 4 protein [Candidatus Competibacter sp.]MDG4606790.1 glycosyltransferase family 4 protein [Candidatus Contendobacter sp.]HRD50126.1 glycosyltransferase family 4 protein [Candidatus Contendobacter sp.]
MVRLSVAQLLPALNGGGVERGTLEVARELVRRGHRSMVISADGRLAPELLRDGSEHLAWPLGVKSPLTLRWVWPLRRWLTEQRIHILHARSRLPAWIGWLAWRGMNPVTRPRFITTVHGLYSISRYSAIMTRSERVIAVSETVREYLQRHYPELPTTRIQVIQRGVDPAAFPYNYRPSAEWLANWHQRYPQLRDAPVLTLPGRLSRLKGHEDFINLIARLRMHGSSVRGLIVGGVEPHRQRYADQLRRMVQAKGLNEVILFTGHRSDMREIYAVSALVLSLSAQPESFGRTVLEALSLGTPVIGYDHGGVGEVLARIYPAGLAPFNDPDALTARVIALLTAAPPVPSEPIFPLQRMLDETLALYESLHQAPRNLA